MTSKSKVSPAIFAASILCFLFPFITVSCGGQRVASFSGIQLATGTSVQQPQMFGPPQKQKVDSEPTAAVAAICAILGLGLSLLGSRLALASAISGAAGAVSLLVMKSRLEDQIVKQGQGMLQVSYETGFFLTLILFLAGVAWNAYLFSQRKQTSAVVPVPLTTDARGRPEAGVIPNPVGGDSNAPTSCPHCGELRASDERFCTNCGKPAGGVVA